MSRGVWADIDRCRRAGLVVDEDFERGISRSQRRWRLAALTALVVLLGLATSYLVTQPNVQDASRRHPAPHRRVLPVNPQPPAHTRGRT